MTDAARRTFSRRQTGNYTSANERRAIAALQRGPDNLACWQALALTHRRHAGQIRLLRRLMNEGRLNILSLRYFP
jgi:hypothetical protein